MKIFVLADAETVLVYALAGIKGQVVTSEADVPAILDGLTRESAGLILITEALAQNNREAIERMMMDSGNPFIVEIPDIHGPLPQRARSTERLLSLMRR
ncbi:MAG: V-type ATP synthase subunit F [Desulfobacterales bacterium]|jgi:vacuolar-type H+-ATPase subunit F/Vma7|nr:V-type ATP synthase subunit F [Desulfobacterales bacterium]